MFILFMDHNRLVKEQAKVQKQMDGYVLQLASVLGAFAFGSDFDIDESKQNALERKINKCQTKLAKISDRLAKV